MGTHAQQNIAISRLQRLSILWSCLSISYCTAFKGSPVKSFNAVVRIPSGKHHPALNNKQSSEFKRLEKQLCSKVRNKLPFSFKTYSA